MATSSADPGNLDLEWPEGDSVMFSFTFQDEVPNPIDLSGNTFYAEYRNRQNSATGYSFTVDSSDAVNGNIDITTPATTGMPNSGIWDLRYKTGGGLVTTLLAGKVSILHSVSDTT